MPAIGVYRKRWQRPRSRRRRLSITAPSVASGYSVSGTLTGNVGQDSTQITISSTGPGAFSGAQTITFTSSNAADTLTSSDGDTGTHAITVTPPARETSFTIRVNRPTAGTSTITFTNGQGWSDSVTIDYTVTVTASMAATETTVKQRQNGQQIHVQLTGATASSVSAFTVSDGWLSGGDFSDTANPILFFCGSAAAYPTITLTHTASGQSVVFTVVGWQQRFAPVFGRRVRARR